MRPFLRALCQYALVVAFPVLAAATPPQLNEAPLRIIVPLPPGSTSDLVARMIAERLRDELARPVIVENHPGATGHIAVDALKSATHPESTLLFAPIAVPVIAPLVFKELNYDPARDLAPVAQVSTYEFVLAVAAND